MKKTTVVLSIAVAAMAVAALMLSVASAAPSAPAQKVVFTKSASNPAPRVGEILTFTWSISPTAAMTQSMEVRVTDPNPASAYLEILTPTITGGAYYSSTLDGVVWDGTLTVGTLPSPVSFQVRVTGIPTTALASGYVVTNTATIVDLATAGSLPGGIAKAAIRIMPWRVFLPFVCRNLGS
jgi:hypothetical protein